MDAPTQKPNQRRTVGWNGDCPHCGKGIRFEVNTDFGTFRDPADKDVDYLATLTPEEQQIIAVAESTGVLACYESVVIAHRGRARQTKKQFLRFIQCATRTKISPEMGLALQATFGGTYRFVVLTCGDLSAVIANEVLRIFVPTAYLHNRISVVEVAEPSNGKQELKIGDLTNAIRPLDTWVKTRMGYVPVEAKLFLREVRKRSYGGFAKI